ncbi:MAG: 4a-hydroxytetrahydrobiopterin dehydratase [Verrucomicrobiales bacterium]|jgi:4a-hydroxytetrahydrobiopterin dehydratase
MPELIPNQQLLAHLAEIPDWSRQGGAIRRTFEFDAFLDGIEFVRKVANLAEEADHHPDIDIRWRKVHLLLTTHSASGLTENDISLAKAIDSL